MVGGFAVDARVDEEPEAEGELHTPERRLVGGGWAMEREGSEGGRGDDVRVLRRCTRLRYAALRRRGGWGRESARDGTWQRWFAERKPLMLLSIFVVRFEAEMVGRKRT